MDNKTAELLPCPFCGGKAEIKQYCKNGLRIKCTGCLIKKEQKVLRYSLEWLHNAMVKDWNAQHQTEALREENEKLRADNERMRGENYRLLKQLPDIDEGADMYTPKD